MSPSIIIFNPCCKIDVYQETKIDSLAVLPLDFVTSQYPAFFSFASKKGYSGVSTHSLSGYVHKYTEWIPKRHVSEGRCVVSDHGWFVLFNLYLVNGESGSERHDYKINFQDELKSEIERYLKQGRQLIVVGDFNIAHTDLDVFDPHVVHIPMFFLFAHHSSCLGVDRLFTKIQGIGFLVLWNQAWLIRIAICIQMKNSTLAGMYKQV